MNETFIKNKVFNILSGFIMITDGIIQVITFGFYCPDWDLLLFKWRLDQLTPKEDK